MPKNVKSPVMKMYPVRVVSDQHTHITDPRDPTDSWSQDDLHHMTTIHGVEEGDEFSGLATPFPLEKGEQYYLVYVVYSTGSSFHHEDGCVAFIDLFKTAEKAEACAKAINDHYLLSENGDPYPYKTAAQLKKMRPKGYSEWTVAYKNEADVDSTVHSSWNGYFERLSEVVVERVTAQPESTNLIRYKY